MRQYLTDEAAILAIITDICYSKTTPLVASRISLYFQHFQTSLKVSSHNDHPSYGPFHGVNQNTANRHISCLLQWQQPIISSDFHRCHFESQKRGHF